MNRKVKFAIIVSLWMIGSIIILPLCKHIYQTQFMAIDYDDIYVTAFACCIMIFWIYPALLIPLCYISKPKDGEKNENK